MRDHDLIGVLGRGTSGVVYLGRRRVDSRPVALKRLADGHGDPRAVARLRREAVALDELAHPGVVGIVELVDDGTELWLATEYVEGATLASLLPLPDTAAMTVVAQLADALDAVHRAGIVHRDVKPANVLIDNTGRCRLVDFGLARFISDSRHAAAGAGVRTATGTLLGTPRYLAPETLDNTATAASDIYSLGVVAYELFVGRVPFDDVDVPALIEAHQHRAPPDPRALRPELSAAQAAALLQALAKAPSDRPATADELWRAIESSAGALEADWRARGCQTLASRVAAAKPSDDGDPSAETLTDDEQARLALPRSQPPVYRGRHRRRALWAAGIVIGAALVGFLATRL